MMASRPLYSVTESFVPVGSIIFQIVRTVFHNAEKKGFYHLEGMFEGTLYQVVWNSYELGLKKLPELQALKDKTYVDVHGKWHIVHRNINGNLTKTHTFLMRGFKPAKVEPTNEDNKDLDIPTASVYKNSNDVDLLLKALDGEKTLRNLREKVKLTEYSSVMDAFEKQQVLKRGIDGDSDKETKRSKSEDAEDEKIKGEAKKEPKEEPKEENKEKTTKEAKAESTEALGRSFSKMSGGDGTSETPYIIDGDKDIDGDLKMKDK